MIEAVNFNHTCPIQLHNEVWAIYWIDTTKCHMVYPQASRLKAISTQQLPYREAMTYSNSTRTQRFEKKKNNLHLQGWFEYFTNFLCKKAVVLKLPTGTLRLTPTIILIINNIDRSLHNCALHFHSRNEKRFTSPLRKPLTIVLQNL